MNSIDYDLIQILYKAKASVNSKTIKENNISLKEAEPELKTLDEYIIKLKNGELLADLSNSRENRLNDFIRVDVVLPEIGVLEMYEPSNVVYNKKDEAYRNEIIEKDLDYDEEKENIKKERLNDYSVITLKDSNGMPFELVLDQDGNDVGKITYDEKGNPSFEMSPELKDTIDEKVEKSKIENFVKPEIIENEFYYKDIDTFIRAIEEDKLNPQSIKDVSLRAIAAQKIYDNDFENEEDVEIALTQTPNEKLKEKEIEDLVERKRNKNEDRLEVPENERNIVIDQRKKDEEEFNIPNNDENTLETNPDRKIIDPDEGKETDEDENSSKESSDVIPEEKREEIEKVCEDNGEKVSDIKLALIVKDAATLADLTTDNDRSGGINRYGNEVTIIQFSGTAGKPRYIGIQEDVKVCEGEEFDDAMDKLIGPYKRTVGIIEKVQDNKTMLDYTDSSGKNETMQLRRIPRDLSDHEKEELKEKLQKDIEELEYYRINYPNEKEIIDKLEIRLCKDFTEAGLTPPKTLEEDAEEETSVEESSEKEIEENQGQNEEEYDPRDPVYKRLFGDKQ